MRMQGLAPALLLGAVVALDASASLPRASSPAIESPALLLTSGNEPSGFSLFEGDEIFRILAKRRTSDDRYTFTWHYDGKIATAVVMDCWPIEHGESQGPACAAGYTRPAQAGHKLVFSYDALSRLLTVLGTAHELYEAGSSQRRRYSMLGSNQTSSSLVRGRNGENVSLKR